MGIFLIFAAIKAAVILLIQWKCQLSGFVLACLIIGALFEFIGGVMLGNWGNHFVRECIFYIPSILLQIVPLLIVSIGYYKLEADDVNFIMATAIGLMGFLQVFSWFTYGNEGEGGFMYAISIIPCYLIVSGIISFCVETYHTLLTVNIVICAICLAIMVIARLIKGSNME